LKLYRVLEGKFILLQDEAETNGESEDEEISDIDFETDQQIPSSSSSNKKRDEAADHPQLDSQEILANIKACPYFRRLHRSKGIFWLATLDPTKWVPGALPELC
jgi:hypothetical protein